MRRSAPTIFLILALLIPTFRVHAQDDDLSDVEIISHQAGEAVRGVVPIAGHTAISGFISWELTFSYVNNPTGTWFLIAEGVEPITQDFLAEWDTTKITDGSYNLRLTVYLDEGRRTHFILLDIRVRNYTPIESSTPTPTHTATPYTLTPPPSSTPTLTINPTDTPLPDTPTPLPTNPIEISAPDVTNSLLRGAGVAFSAFLILGIYRTIRGWIGKT
jgi:hypothetical protein